MGQHSTIADIAAHLKALGVAIGDHLAVHSRLLSFGRIEEGAASVYKALLEAIGPEGTLAFPTYTLKLDASTPFDPDKTPSERMGVLPEFARQVPGVRRTLCPLHSHAVVGHFADAVLAADPTRSLGPKSSFETMLQCGFKLLLLGCTFQEGATFIHHVEAMVGVPYRKWIDLDRRVREPDGNIRQVKCPYYARRRELSFANDLRACEAAAQSEPEAISIPIGSGKRQSHLLPLESLDRCVRGLLSLDPYVLVAGGDKA